MSTGEIALGAALLIPFVPSALVGAALVGFSAGLVQLYLNTPGMRQADSIRPTPEGLGLAKDVWLLGAGMTLMLMDRSEEALPWLQRSLAITPGSGRTHMLLSAVYQQLGRTHEARAAMQKGIELRPGSNLGNVVLPPRNASRPTRQNWWTAVLPDRNAWSWISACPPTTAPPRSDTWS